MSTANGAAATDLDPYLEGLQAAPATELLAGLERPCDPRDALPLPEIDRMLDPAPLKVETGWCRMDDGVGFVAVRTEFPGVTAEMIDWWFDWHPRSPERYVAWHPVAHFDNSLVPPETPGEKPYWGALNLAVEDIGEGRRAARIEFLDPRDFGFGAEALAGDAVGTIVCAKVGDRFARHSLMAHVFLNEGDGLVLRSHFWLGGAVGLRLPGPLAGIDRPLGPLLNSGTLRRRLLRDSTLRSLAVHCAEEYTNLATILPPIHERFAS